MNVEDYRYWLKQVNIDGDFLQSVPLHLIDLDMVLTAIRNKKQTVVLEYVPPVFRTRQVCLEAFAMSEHNLEFVPDKYKTLEMCHAAVEYDGTLLEFVPAPFRTEALMLTACTTDGYAIRFVHSALQTEEMVLAAVTENYKALECVRYDRLTDAACVAAIKQSRDAFELIPAWLRSPALSRYARDLWPKEHIPGSGEWLPPGKPYDRHYHARSNNANVKPEGRMRAITQAEFDAVERNIRGHKCFPAGHYKGVVRVDDSLSFPAGCTFVSGTVFGARCYFGEGCMFGDNCRFGEDCGFGIGCQFGTCVFEDGCSFRELCSFGAFCIFRAACRFAGNCTFGLSCGFGDDCRFGEKCTYDLHCRFGKSCSFSALSQFGNRCQFGDSARFADGCIFEEIYTAKPGYPYIAIEGCNGSVPEKVYIWNFVEGIYVRDGGNLLTLSEYKVMYASEWPDNAGFFLSALDLIEKEWTLATADPLNKQTFRPSLPYRRYNGYMKPYPGTRRE